VGLCGFVRKNAEYGVLCCFVRKDNGNGVYIVLFGRIPGMWFCSEICREWGFMWIFSEREWERGFYLVSLSFSKKMLGWVVITIAVS
jgi:hypothetical protein